MPSMSHLSSIPRVKEAPERPTGLCTICYFGKLLLERSVIASRTLEIGIQLCYFSPCRYTFITTETGHEINKNSIINYCIIIIIVVVVVVVVVIIIIIISRKPEFHSFQNVANSIYQCGRDVL